MTARALRLALLAGLAGCDGGANPNVVDEWFLRPALLREDPQQVAAYMAKLPDGVYRERELDGVGRFYIDNGKDSIKRHLVELFPKYVKAGSTVVDAGAAIGVHTVALARLAGPGGRVYAFEPQRKLHRQLVFNLRLNRIENAVPLRYALGHTAGVSAPGKAEDRVELRPLDSFGLRNVSLIRIDMEQFEDYVLEGAQLTIGRYRPILIIEITGNRKRIEATHARLKQLGYRVGHIAFDDYLALPE